MLRAMGRASPRRKLTGHVAQLTEAGYAKIFHEKIIGTTTNRQQFRKLMAVLQLSLRSADLSVPISIKRTTSHPRFPTDNGQVGHIAPGLIPRLSRHSL